MNLLNNLNSQQKKAVKITRGPLLIVAGPGTGKTKTLTDKIIYLIKEKKVNPANILALTFTQKAALEIKERVDGTLKGSYCKPFIGTFHGLGHFILKKNAALKTPNLTKAKGNEENNAIELISPQERNNLIRDLQKKFRSSSSKNINNLKKFSRFSIRDLSLLISKYKTDLIKPKDKKIARLVKKYNQALKEKGLYDFDDLLVKAYKLLNKDQVLKEFFQKRFRYILLDEFQDTSPIQYELIKLISTPPNNIFAIGDPNQAIYSFRGASNEAFNEFRKDFPEFTEIALKDNYRNAPEIIKISQSLFPNSTKLRAKLELPGKILELTTFNEYSEADWIIDEINRKIGGVDFLKASAMQNFSDKEIHFSQFAIIYRTHNLNRALKQKFRDSGIPYQVVGGDSFWENKEIIFILELLKYYASGEKDQLIKALGESINFKKVDLINKKKEKLGLIQLVELIIDKFDLGSGSQKSKRRADKPDYQERPDCKNRLDWKNKLNRPLHFDELFSVLIAFDEDKDSLKSFLDYFSKIAQTDFYDPDAQKVTLCTMHAVKGLEFKYVFLVGFEQGFIPYLKKGVDLDEEKRLFYVALTRAQQGLYLLYAKERFKGKNKISPFAEEINYNDVDKITDEKIKKIEKKREKQKIKEQQTALF